MASDDTAPTLRQMSYVGGMNYARYRLEEATASMASAKGKLVRAPALLTQTISTGQMVHRDQF